MQLESNGLRRRDLAGLVAVENAFLNGPLASAMAKAPHIERRSGLSREAFDQEYRRHKRPVILEGLTRDWPSVRTWSFEHLVQRCGDTRVTVDSYSSQKAREVSFADFVRMLDESRDSGAAPIYLQEWYYQTTCPWLAQDMPELDIAQYDFRRNLYGAEASTNHQLWIGQKGGITRLHQDSYMVDVMHAQIVGEKRWHVMGPQAHLRAGGGEGDNEGVAGEADFQALCADPAAQLMQCILRPGDVLYLPAMWFHRIELLSDSMGLGRKCLDESNLQLHIRQRMTELLALALNQEEVKKTHPELFKVVMLRNRAMAKRMNIDLSSLRP